MRFILRVLARRHSRHFIIILALDAVVFGGGDARQVPSFMLIVGFILLLATIYHLFYGLLALARLYGLRLKQPSRFALYMTGLAGGLVALQSIGELSPRDVAVLLPLVALAYLYGSYGTGKAV